MTESFPENPSCPGSPTSNYDTKNSSVSSFARPLPMPILITYASSRGSTREIAERIATRLHQSGFGVDCRPVDHVFSVNSYSAVILGSAVHGQQWLLDAVKFLDIEAMGLQMRPVWAYSVGMAPVSLPAWIRERALKKEVKKIEDTIKRKVPKLRDHQLFAGKNDGSATAPPVRGLYTCLGGRFGDMRDWNAIDAWADMIAKELRVELA